MQNVFHYFSNVYKEILLAFPEIRCRLKTFCGIEIDNAFLYKVAFIYDCCGVLTDIAFYFRTVPYRIETFPRHFFYLFIRRHCRTFLPSRHKRVTNRRLLQMRRLSIQ